MNDLSAWIERHADFIPDKTALSYEGRAISYRDLNAMVTAQAQALKHIYGIGRGDRVAYLGLNSPEFLALMFACARLGALFIPLNWRLAGPEHVYILKDAAAKALLCEEEFKSHAEALQADLPDCEFVAIDFDGDGWLSLSDGFEQATGDDRNPHVDLETPLLLVYTSGTTGHPKGAVLTQAAVQWNALNAVHMHAMTGDDHILTVLPMFHVGGLNIQTTPALYVGATITLHRKFDPVAVLSALGEDRPSLVVLVPATIQALASHPAWAKSDLSSLRAVATGSSIVPLALIDVIHARHIPVLQIYGSTETGPVVIYLRADDAMTHVGSTGKTALHCDARVVDEAGDDAAVGESGEIWVRGPNIMFEYWGNADATTKAFSNGWFKTGDLGYRDGDGFFYVNDRKTDVVISGGENIYPAELETVLDALPGVTEAAVVGRADDHWGEVPVAVVVAAPDSDLTRESVLKAFDGALARFKHPKDVVFVEALPRNVMGKVQKFDLKVRVANKKSPMGLD